MLKALHLLAPSGRSTMVRSMSSGSGSVGFIGLGNMGLPMAMNLAKAGHSVVVHDVSAENAKKAEAGGAAVVSNPAEVAAASSVVVTMLPSSPHVKEVYGGANGILGSVNKDALLIDCSTIEPDVAKAVAADARASGATMVDAPVSGGTMGAEQATLTFMVGGSDDGFSRAKPFLEKMGKNIVHCGEDGTGQIAKVCNNLVLGITMAGVSEAFLLATKLGMDPTRLAGIINTSSGRSWSSEVYNPCPGVLEGVPSSRGYTGGFGCTLMAKDLGLANAAAANSKTAMPMGALAFQLYTLMGNSNMSEKDFSGMFEFLSRKD